MCHRFFLGRCPFSALSCNFSHSKDYVPLCRMWTMGQCIGSVGNACKFRHYYNEFDRIAKEKEKTGRPIANDLNEEDFNSPYRLKVIKEVSKQRKEEVDLETGKRKSWIETTEFEVLDLTGETPAKKKRPLVLRSPLKESMNNESNQKESQKEEESIKSAINPSICPFCKRTFKGSKGVKSHQNARNSSCRPLKENLEMDPKVKSPHSNLSTEISSGNNADESIIVIPDTPVIQQPKVLSKRLLRSRNVNKDL